MPRTTATPSVSAFSDTSDVVCAVSEARGVSPSVGIALFDVSLGNITLSQISDDQSFVRTIHQIRLANPAQILFMSTACPPNAPSTLYSMVEDLVPNCEIESFDRSAWSEVAGLEYIADLAFEGDVEPIKVAVEGKFYATSSLAAASSHTTRRIMCLSLTSYCRSSSSSSNSAE
jgi:DNA mismatch repair protein MSH4